MDVNVWELRIVMHRGNPFELGAEVHFHLGQHFTRQFFQVKPVPKLGGNDQLEHSRIAGLLPRAKCRVNIWYRSCWTKCSNIPGITVDRTFTRDVAAVAGPLALRAVCGILDPDRAPLHERP